MPHRDSRSIPQRASALLLVLCLGLTLAHTAGAGPVTPTPAQLNIRAMQPGVLLRLSGNGQPVPAAQIGAVRFMVETRDYTYMLSIQKTDGALLLTPTDDIQMGSYSLFVEVPGETLSIPVLAPLDLLPNSLECLSKKQGKSIDDIKKDLGLSTTLARKQVELNLPDSYFQGQELTLSLSPAAHASYEWKINGTAVAKGTGPHTFSYVFPGTGDYVVDYTESVDGVVVAQSVEMTMVNAEPAVALEVKKGVRVDLKGPEGFGDHAWLTDGALQGTGATLSKTFDAPGTHLVTCTAMLPVSGPDNAFRIVSYRITVTD
ncbi:MAG: hypothetical protein HYV27_10025 [Candidatus Hydrogenedentes bacterium]|nr:hypothetical protein [Candidatus Hydrogenedentota bacterium]